MSPAEARTWGGLSLRSVRGLQSTEEHCQIQHIQQPVNPSDPQRVPHAFRESLWYSFLSTWGLCCGSAQWFRPHWTLLNISVWFSMWYETTRRKQVEWEARLGQFHWQERHQNGNVMLRNCYWPQHLDVSPLSVRRKGIVMAWIIKSLLYLRRNQSKLKLAATSLYKYNILSLLPSLSPPLSSSLSHTIIIHKYFNLLIVRNHHHHFTIRALEIQGSKMKALREYQPSMAGRLTGLTEQFVNPSVCPLSLFLLIRQTVSWVT